jgi:hypothetical protein
VALDGCTVGALIGRIGGSTADFKADKDKFVLFGVGKYCVFTGPEAMKTGCLYLGINDTPAAMAKVQGHLEVTIWEAL